MAYAVATLDGNLVGNVQVPLEPAIFHWNHYFPIIIHTGLAFPSELFEPLTLIKDVVYE